MSNDRVDERLRGQLAKVARGETEFTLCEGCLQRVLAILETERADQYRVPDPVPFVPNEHRTVVSADHVVRRVPRVS